MKRHLASFQLDLAAGCTIDTPERRGEVDRPTGMDGWILNLTTAGAARIGRGATGFTATRGRLLLFKPAVAHDYGPLAPDLRWTHLWVYFFPRSHWFAWLSWPEAAPGILSLDVAGHELLPRITALFEEVIATSRGPWPRRTALAMSQLEQLLLWCEYANPEPRGALDPRVQQVIDQLGSRLEEQWSISKLARIAGLSESRLAHLFRAQTGATPLQFLEQQRIARARELLLITGRSVAEIAAAVGMPDTTWFARVFRRHVGMSPRNWRQGAGSGKRGTSGALTPKAPHH